MEDQIKDDKQLFGNHREFRYIITQACNYDCFFCHQEGISENQKPALDADDYKFFFTTTKKHFGSTTTTISGGEPLIRKDIVDITRKLQEEGADTTILTNGYLLDNNMDIGNHIKRLNVSIHSLEKNQYEDIVRTENTYEKAIQNIREFRENHPNVEVRINTAFVKDVNTSPEQVQQYLNFAKDIEASIKYMEIYPKNNEVYEPLEKLESILEDKGYHFKKNISRKKIYSKDGFDVHITKIFCSSASEQENPAEYCKRENDIFITPEGFLKPCRNNDSQNNVRNETKQRNESKLVEKISETINNIGEKCYLCR